MITLRFTVHINREDIEHALREYLDRSADNATKNGFENYLRILLKQEGELYSKMHHPEYEPKNDEQVQKYIKKWFPEFVE